MKFTHGHRTGGEPVHVFPRRDRVGERESPTAYTLADGRTKSFGAVWHLNAAKTFSLYGNLNNSFDPEYRTQPDGSPLDPQVGKQKEVGLRFSLLRGRVSGLVT
ncbi:MAG: hypothetical protein WCJ30_28290, partial [Deltaproteobacteria bacterium]